MSNNKSTTPASSPSPGPRRRIFHPRTPSTSSSSTTTTTNRTDGTSTFYTGLPQPLPAPLNRTQRRARRRAQLAVNPRIHPTAIELHLTSENIITSITGFKTQQLLDISKMLKRIIDDTASTSPTGATYISFDSGEGDGYITLQGVTALQQFLANNNVYAPPGTPSVGYHIKVWAFADKFQILPLRKAAHTALKNKLQGLDDNQKIEELKTCVETLFGTDLHKRPGGESVWEDTGSDVFALVINQVGMLLNTLRKEHGVWLRDACEKMPCFATALVMGCQTLGNTRRGEDDGTSMMVISDSEDESDDDVDDDDDETNNDTPASSTNDDEETETSSGNNTDSNEETETSSGNDTDSDNTQKDEEEEDLIDLNDTTTTATGNANNDVEGVTTQLGKLSVGGGRDNRSNSTSGSTNPPTDTDTTNNNTTSEGIPEHFQVRRWARSYSEGDADEYQRACSEQWWKNGVASERWIGGRLVNQGRVKLWERENRD